MHQIHHSNLILKKNVTIIRNIFNKGYAAACNQGLLEVSTEWTLFLNPDVEIDAENLESFVNYAEYNHFAAASVETKSADYSKPIPSFLSLLTEFTPMRKVLPRFLFKSKTLIGGVLLIRTELLKSIGGWDERFFLWFEDSDLSKKLQLRKHTFGFAPIRITHLGGFSLKKLTNNAQKDLFFNAMDVYSKKYLNNWQQKIITKIKQRFTQKKLITTTNTQVTSIVVPNLKKDLLDHFLKNNKKYFSDDLEIIIVTSALTSRSVWEYRRQFPNIRFIVLNENHGFAHTVNIGLRAATGAYIGTCNDDVTLSKDWHKKLLKSAQKNTGSLNPIILNSDSSIESAGISIEKIGKAHPITKKPQKNTQVDATNGACVLYKRDALQKTGIFDEKFGSYLEDIDLSLRLTNNGFKNIVSPAVSVTHLKHQTSGSTNFNKSYYDFINWWRVVIKNWSMSALLKNLPGLLLERARNFSGLIKSNKKESLIIFGSLLLALIYVITRLYKIETSLLFFNDIGRDFLVLFKWDQTGKPPLLGPQTSALPYNQSAFYFYMLYPMYFLTQHSPFATIYTAVLFYTTAFIFGLSYLKNNKALRNSFVLSFLLIIIHPQFIIQNRFVWNPTFLGPLILLAFYAFQKLQTNFSKLNVAVFALALTFAVSLNYSAAPLFIAFMIWAVPVFWKNVKFIKLYLASIVAGLFWNLPTVAFELRHGFLLTKMLLSGNRPPQVSITFLQKTADLYKYVFNYIPYRVGLLFSAFIGVSTLVSFQKKLKYKINSSHLVSATVLLLLTVAITYLAPISMQAHYIFAVLTMLFIVISLLNKYLYIVVLLLLSYYWLQPAVVTRYIETPYRTVEQTQACSKLLCTKETQPLFVSVQSDLHPYHNGMEFKYMFSESGCDIKELHTQIDQAQHMAVVVDHSEYTHGKTTYNELAQFGESTVQKSYVCSEDLEIILLKRE